MKRSEAWTRALCLTLAVGLMSVIAVEPVAAQEVPYDGVVVEDKVQVRAGMGRVHYVVGELERGAVVRVDEIFLGWHKIVPPQGVTSYISKAFVDARGDGGSGRVNTNRTKVMAASVKGPGESYRVQVTLNEGDTVQILGEEGSYYRIAPPQSTYVFLPPGSVRRAEVVNEPSVTPQAIVEEETAVAAEPSAAPAGEEVSTVAAEVAEGVTADAGISADVNTAAEQSLDETAVAVSADDPEAVATVSPEPTAADRAEAMAAIVVDAELAEEASVEDASAEAETPKAVVAAKPVKTPAVSEALRAVEQENLPLFALSLREQPIEQMIAAYEAVLEQAELPGVDQRIVRQRLTALQHNQRVVAAIRSLDDARSASAESAQAAKAAEEAATEAGEARPVAYDAVGRLLASSVFDGQSLPRMYRLVDPGSGRTVAYVEPGGPIDDFRMLGKVVGIVGERSYDASIKRQVIQIEKINLLAAAETE